MDPILMIFMAILMCIIKKQVVPPFTMYCFTNPKLSINTGAKLFIGLARVYCIAKKIFLLIPQFSRVVYFRNGLSLSILQILIATSL